MKVSIVGIGKVGSALGFALVMKDLCRELVLVNRSPKIAEAEAADLMHAQSFGARQMKVTAGDVIDTMNSDVIAICASVPWDAQKMKTRMDLAIANWSLFEDFISPLAKASPNAIFIIVSNPVDVLVYRTLKLSGFPASRVIGTGTLVDSARYRALISEATDIHSSDIRAYILGEHGDSQFPALSIAMIGGERADNQAAQRAYFDQAVASGYHVFKTKGYTNYAIARAAAMMIETIAIDGRHTMPISTLVEGYLGVEDVCLSVPCVLGRTGIMRTLRPALNDDETQAFAHSAQVVRHAIDACQASCADVSRQTPSQK